MNTITTALLLPFTKLKDGSYNRYSVMSTTPELVVLSKNYTRETLELKYSDIPADFRVEEESPKAIKAFVNQAGYTDVKPYEVVRVVSENCVEIRAMDTEQIQGPGEIIPGGFVGHYPDQRQQDYKYISNPENTVFKIRWSNVNRKWQDGNIKFYMADAPYRFYDYNF